MNAYSVNHMTRSIILTRDFTKKASHHRDFLRQLVVARIAVCVQIAPEALQEGCWMLRAPSWLVLVQHNGTLHVAVAAEPASPVQPHVAL